MYRIGPLKSRPALSQALCDRTRPFKWSHRLTGSYPCSRKEFCLGFLQSMGKIKGNLTMVFLRITMVSLGIFLFPTDRILFKKPFFTVPILVLKACLRVPILF